MKDIQRFKGDFALFSADEKVVLLGFLAEGGGAEFVERLAAARRRTQQRADSDAATDARRRLTVGVRLPRELVEKYRACATEHGLSMYRFTCNALEREHARLMESNTSCSTPTTIVSKPSISSTCL